MAAYLAAHRSGQIAPGRCSGSAPTTAGVTSTTLAHLLLAQAHEICPPFDRLFVERCSTIYEILEHAVASYHVGDHAGAIDANNRLLRSDVLRRS